MKKMIERMKSRTPIDDLAQQVYEGQLDIVVSAYLDSKNSILYYHESVDGCGGRWVMYVAPDVDKSEYFNAFVRLFNKAMERQKENKNIHVDMKDKECNFSYANLHLCHQVDPQNQIFPITWISNRRRILHCSACGRRMVLTPLREVKNVCRRCELSVFVSTGV